MDQRISDIAKFYDNPLGFVIYAFPWGEDSLEGYQGPDAWQFNFLSDLGKKVKENAFDGRAPCPPILMATASGHGIGKSALVAWLVLWIMSTRPFSKGIITANTLPQLETKTWAEIIKWHKLSINRDWFHYSASKSAMRLHHVDHRENWRVDAITCREENSESFAGLHAANATPFYIFDEASAIPDSIWDVAEGGLTDGEAMWFCFGNPTRNHGRFHKCFHGLSHRWRTKQIDSRSCTLPNKELIAQWEKDYGENSDFFKIRVRGVFPSNTQNQFFDGDSIYKSMK